MARKKYQKKKENLNARLESEGLKREHGRIVPKEKPKKETEAVIEVTPKKDKAVVPPAAKNQPVSSKQQGYKPSVKSTTVSSSSQYGWLQKTIVFVIAGVLVGGGLIAAGLGQSNGVEILPSEQPVILPSEQPLQEIEVTTEPTS